MQLDSSFSVVAPIDTVWKTVMDFERVVGCVPGAQIVSKLSDDAYQGVIKVKIGPVSMEYKGQITVVERDEAAHKASFQGRAQESRGQGTADGTATLQLSEVDGTTTGVVSAEFALGGKVAAMGKGVINSVTEQMVGLFAKNLQALVMEEPASAPSEAAATSAAPPTGLAGSPEAPSGSGESPPAAVKTEVKAPAKPAAENSLDAFALGRSVAADMLRRPAAIVTMVVVAAVVAFLLGRFSASWWG